MENKTFKLVNWESGMHPTSSHIRQVENFFLDGLCKSHYLSLNPNNIGLIRPIDYFHDDACEITVENNITDRIKILLKHCCGITGGGYIVDYKASADEIISCEKSYEEIEKESNASTAYWNIVLTVNPYERILVGKPDQDEFPPRYPDVIPSYDLHLVPISSSNSKIDNYSIIVGRLKKNALRYEKDMNYIPPCANMQSFSSLLQFYDKAGNLFGFIEKASKDIITKVVNRTDASPMAIHIMEMSKSILYYSSTFFFQYCNMGKYTSPVQVIGNFSALAHLCYSILNSMEKSEKEDVLKYFNEWSGVPPSAFEGILIDLMVLTYEHGEINSMNFVVEGFLKTFSDLWVSLASLEYIGKHKENVVVGERTERRDTGTVQTKWSPVG